MCYWKAHNNTPRKSFNSILSFSCTCYFVVLCCICLHLHFIKILPQQYKWTIFLVTRHCNFLLSIVFAYQSDSVVNPWPRSGLGELTLLWLPPETQGYFIWYDVPLYIVSLMHPLCIVALLDCIEPFSLTIWFKSLRSPANPSQEYLIQDKDHHHRNHCTSHILQHTQWLHSAASAHGNTSNSSKRCCKTFSFWFQHQHSNRLISIAAWLLSTQWPIPAYHFLDHFPSWDKYMALWKWIHIEV